MAVFACGSKMGFAGRSVTSGTFVFQALTTGVAHHTVQCSVSAFQRRWMLETIHHFRLFEPIYRVTILAYGFKVGGHRWLVTVGALVRWFLHAFVTVVAPDLGVLALPRDGMGEGRIQVHRGPGPAVTGRVGTKARIVATKGDLIVAVHALIVGQEAVISHKLVSTCDAGSWSEATGISGGRSPAFMIIGMLWQMLQCRRMGSPSELWCLPSWHRKQPGNSMCPPCPLLFGKDCQVIPGSSNTTRVMSSLAASAA